MKLQYRIGTTSGDLATISAVLVMFSGLCAMVAAFITHVWWIFGLLMSDVPLTGGKVLIAVLGVFIPPIGVLHGAWLWFH